MKWKLNFVFIVRRKLYTKNCLWQRQTCDFRACALASWERDNLTRSEGESEAKRKITVKLINIFIISSRRLNRLPAHCDNVHCITSFSLSSLCPPLFAVNIFMRFWQSQAFIYSFAAESLSDARIFFFSFLFSVVNVASWNLVVIPLSVRVNFFFDFRLIRWSFIATI
jgi:hypothetical protein